MDNRLIPLSDWALMFVGLVAVAVLLSVIDRDTALWEDEQEGRDDV